MSFDKQVSETCKACFFHIRALCHIRASLTNEASKTIAAAIAGSRLDYRNSLLAGTSVSNLTRASSPGASLLESDLKRSLKNRKHSVDLYGLSGIQIVWGGMAD